MGIDSKTHSPTAFKTADMEKVSMFGGNEEINKALI